MAVRKSEETKERILEAAINIFSQKGFSASTTSEIAKEAKVAEGTIFKYYPKKKDLLSGVILKAVDIFEEIVVFNPLIQVIKENKDKPIEELLKAIAMDRVKIFEQYSSYAKVIINEMQFHKDVQELFFNKIAEEIFSFGKEIFDEIKEKEEIRDINSLIAIRSFAGMLFLMIMQRHFIPSKNTTENFEEDIDIVIDIFLNGVKKQ